MVKIHKIFIILLTLMHFYCANGYVYHSNPFDNVFEVGDYKMVLSQAVRVDNTSVSLSWTDISVIDKIKSKNSSLSNLNFVSGKIFRTAANSGFSQTEIELLKQSKSIASSSIINEVKNSIISTNGSYSGNLIWQNLDTTQTYEFIIEIVYLDSFSITKYMHSNIVKYSE